ncbi:MAG: choice-of-anchor B family protein [Bacteroidota bacterium]
MRFASLFALLFAASAAAQVPCTNGSATLNGVTYECDGIDVLSNIPVGVNNPFRTGALNDIWGWTDPTNGKEYALVGTRSGTVFVDVSTPTAPRVLGKLTSTGGINTTWRDIKVYRDHAFVGSEATGHGIQVFDLTRLRGLSEDANRDFAPDVLYDEVGSSHNVVINEDTGFLYAVGARTPGPNAPAACAARGFHAIDITTPTNPTFAGCFSDASQDAMPRITPGYTHDAQCVVYSGPDTEHQGKEICLAANEDVVTLFDVSDKNNVSILSQAQYPLDAYTHQGWFTEDQRYALVNDELDETNGLVSTQRTLVFDMSDLDSPELAFVYDSGITTIDHNNYTLGQYVYQANYESGLRILDMSQIANGTLTEVAFFDTYPQATTASFNGMWSVYPYFTSGNVIVSDSNTGMFVLRPQPPVLSGELTPIDEPFALSAPQPNPTLDRTTLTLQVRETQTVSARLYDLSGRELAVIFDGTLAAQRPTALAVDASALPTGVYVIRVSGETFSTSERLTVVR